MRRIPYLGCTNFLVGLDSVESVLGPLSHTLSGCITFTKSIIQAEPWRLDPTVVNKTWDQSAFDNIAKLGKLCFGYYKHDGELRPHPPVDRAVEMTAAALRKAGHEVIEWKPPNHAAIYETCWDILTSVRSLIYLQ